MVYAPIIEKVKRSLERRFGYSRRSDIEDVVYSEFMHMLQMYDSTRARHLKFPNFLKSYFEGWCNRHLSQIMATTRKGPTFLNSNNFSESQSDHIELLSGASHVDQEGPDMDAATKDIIKHGLDTVKKKLGERAVDALLWAYLYNYTHIEISELLGCTQARVSQMLQEAKECFTKKITSEGL
jgi:RNA polymerase sigma factor (sigma-70 family)